MSEEIELAYIVEHQRRIRQECERLSAGGVPGRSSLGWLFSLGVLVAMVGVFAV